ncbi:hypothetical protein KTGMC3_P1505 [Methanocalculus sp. MC3]
MYHVFRIIVIYDSNFHPQQSEVITYFITYDKNILHLCEALNFLRVKSSIRTEIPPFIEDIQNKKVLFRELKNHSSKREFNFRL